MKNNYPLPLILDIVENISKSIEINNYNHIERRKEKNFCLDKDYKLFVSKNWFEVVKVDHSIVSELKIIDSIYFIFLFRT